MDDEQVGGNLLGEHGRSQILVDNGSRTAQVALFVGNDRNTPTTGGNHNVTILHEFLDDIGFDDAQRFGRGDHTPPAAAGSVPERVR